MSSSSESDVVQDEGQLLEQIAAENREAFRDLYARYGAPLYSFALRMVGQPADAEDVLQDAFVKIWKSAGTYDPRKSRPFTWAVMILRRTGIDHLRKRRRDVPTVPITGESDLASATTHQDSVQREVQDREHVRHIHSALGGIAPDHRRILELALFSGMTHVEIARELKHPVGTVKSWIRRGLIDLHTTIHDSAP